MNGFLDGILNAYFITDLAGVLLSFVVLWFLSKSLKPFRRELYGVLLVALVGLFIGCHIMYLIIHVPQLVSEIAAYPLNSFADLLGRIYNAASGLAFFGGLFGAVSATLIACRIWHLNSRIHLNILAVLFPLYQFAGRIGCSLSGCCYGIEYHGIFAIQYTKDFITEGINDDLADFTRFPIQPLESLLGLVLFFVMLALYLKKRNSLPLIFVYIPIYSIIRFFDEFLRADEIRGIWGPLSASQWISLACIIWMAVYWCTFKKRTKNFY